ncbi:class I SAM-dependent methyltransferase [candidate division WWE3 bacterium]|nr:class I SAM-dependent methyltransferase [candidate division WWE3 bacterium]
MAKANLNSKIIATTIDTEGLDFSIANIKELGLDKQIETKIEDLTKEYPYPANYFDYIYARLVLHYLSFQELDNVLNNFKKSLKSTGHLFIVVRSEKNVDRNKPDIEYDPITRLTKVFYRDENKNIIGTGVRYFHTPETIKEHLEKAGFKIDYIKEFEEQLYKDFMRTKIAPRLDHVIEVHAF